MRVLFMIDFVRYYIEDEGITLKIEFVNDIGLQMRSS